MPKKEKYTDTQQGIWAIYSSPGKRSIITNKYIPPVFLCALEGMYCDVLEEALNLPGFVNDQVQGEIRPFSIRKVDKTSKISKLLAKKEKLNSEMKDLDKALSVLRFDGPDS